MAWIDHTSPAAEAAEKLLKRFYIPPYKHNLFHIAKYSTCR